MDLNRLEWLVSRGSGLAAFVVLSAAVIAGLGLSLRWTARGWPAALTAEAHRTLTSLALWLTGLHMVMLLLDTQSGFGLTQLLVPFAAQYRPAAMALGILGLFAMGAVAASTRLRGRIGYRRWRQLHMLAFVAYVAALFHGLLGGTSTGAPWATFMYLTSAAMVGGLVLLRIFPERGGAPASPPAARPPEAGPPARTPGDLPPLGARPAPARRPELPPLR